MTREDILSMVDRWQEALNAHDVKTLTDMFTDDAEFLTSFRIVEGGQKFDGKPGITRFFTEMFPKYPSLQAVIDSVLVDEETQAIAVEYRWGSPNTAGSVDWVVTALVAYIQNGKFRSFRFYRRS